MNIEKDENNFCLYSEKNTFFTIERDEAGVNHFRISFSDGGVFTFRLGKNSAKEVGTFLMEGK